MSRRVSGPTRLSIPFDQWPALDRRLWAVACDPGDVFDEGGRASNWADVTREGRMWGYGRWLTFLDQTGALDPTVHPADRATPGQIQRYVQILRIQCGSRSVCDLVVRLYTMLRALAPERDWAWLGRIANRLRAAARPARPIEPRLRPARDLFDEGIRRALMAEEMAPLSPMAEAVAFRDGLMVALLAACPLRRRSFVALIIGQHVLRCRDGSFVIVLEPGDVKNQLSLDFPLPPAIGTLLGRYIDIYRPRLARSSTSRRLWMTQNGRAMSTGQMSARIRKLTAQWLGTPVSMHLFRHAAATSMAIDAPEQAWLIAGLLGHRTLRTAERHYNKARAIEAAKGYHHTIHELRRTFRTGVRR